MKKLALVALIALGLTNAASIHASEARKWHLAGYYDGFVEILGDAAYTPGFSERSSYGIHVVVKPDGKIRGTVDATELTHKHGVRSRTLRVEGRIVGRTRVVSNHTIANAEFRFSDGATLVGSIRSSGASSTLNSLYLSYFEIPTGGTLRCVLKKTGYKRTRLTFKGGGTILSTDNGPFLVPD